VRGSAITAKGIAMAEGAAPRLLLVEDDRDLAGLLAEALHAEGYAVDVAPDGQRGLHLGLTGRHDVLVVDRGLPAVDGLDLVERLRRQGVVAPILFLTARGTVADRVAGLDAGAEDYLVKPFDLDELLARLRALLRRRGEQAEEVRLGEARLVVGQRLVVRRDGTVVALSSRESDLLEVLARRPEQVFTRRDLADWVFDGAETTGVVDTYVHYLRRKLGRQAVVTVRGVGYRLGRP
jgi:two-component system, OmpR family, response regulator